MECQYQVAGYRDCDVVTGVKLVGVSSLQPNPVERAMDDDLLMT
jgi:hypothetical protein